MTARTDVHRPVDGPRKAGSSGRPAGPSPGPHPGEGRPNLTGDLDSLLGNGPAFRGAVRGYDRLQVDNYVSWAETELQSARRQVEELTGRYGSCLAELEISRRLLAQTPTGRELSRISERIGQMLRLAADEAADLSAAGAREADRIVGEARTEADAILRKAHDVKAAALAQADRIRHEARAARAEATALLDRGRREAAELLQTAALERRGVDEQTEEARECLRRLTAQVGEAIDAIAGDLRRGFGRPGQPLPIPHRFERNTVLPVDGAAVDGAPVSPPVHATVPPGVPAQTAPGASADAVDVPPERTG